MIKYVFFDFNGTILNDLDLCIDLLNEILRKQNKKEVTKEEYKKIFGFPISSYYERAGVDFNLNSFEELSSWFIKEYQPKSYSCKLYPNLIQTVRLLKEKGITVVVLSASEINNLKDQLNKLNIIDYFDYVLGLDNIYAKSKIMVGKNFILEHNISPSEVLFVGDTDHDGKLALELKAKGLLFSGGHQAREVLEPLGLPIIDDLKEIINYL